MARLPIPIKPTGHVSPSKRCEQCADARKDAVETTARKRKGKQAADTTARKRKGKQAADASQESNQEPGTSNPEP